MLVLSRKPGESIQIGEDIYVTVVVIGPGRVRLGITAPRAVNIARPEVARVFDRQRLDAAGQSCREHAAAVRR